MMTADKNRKRNPVDPRWKGLAGTGRVRPSSRQKITKELRSWTFTRVTFTTSTGGEEGFDRIHKRKPDAQTCGETPM